MSSPEQGVSRYTLDPAASWIETADDGEWVRFTDYQAERERREGLEATATAQGAELHDADLRLQALEGVVEELRQEAAHCRSENVRFGGTPDVIEVRETRADTYERAAKRLQSALKDSAA